MEKKMLPGIDVFKFLASLMVVLIHTKPFVLNIETQYFSQCFFRIAVPFFFLASSYFLYQNYGEGKIWKYVKRLLKIYLYWFVIEIYFTYRVFFVDVDDSLNVCILRFVHGLFINNSFFASWFLMASIQASIIVTFFINRRKRVLYYLTPICVILACTWTMWYGLFDNPIEPTYNWIYWSGVVLCYSNSFIVAIPYFFAGYLLTKKESVIQTISTSRLLIALIVMLIIASIEVNWCYNLHRVTDQYYSLLPLSIIIFLLLSRITTKETNILYLYLRRCSILIYLLHYVFVYILMTFYSYDYGMILSISVLVLSVFFSITIVKLSNYLQILKNLY